MTETQAPSRAARSARMDEFDAVIVGGSLAGSAAAIALGRAGARVALVEQRPDPQAYKQVCSHFIQASAVPTLERLGLLAPMLDAGAVRSTFRIWTRWGWIVPPRDDRRAGINLRRSKLDPLLRETALATPGVESLLGHTAVGLLGGAGERVSGVVVRDRSGAERELRARLTVGADGRGSKVARLSGVATRTTPHGRFAYGAYFEGGAPYGAPDASLWMLDPQWAAGFPTDSGLTFYAAMPTKARLPEFRRDPLAALVKLLADLPDPPPIHEGRVVEAVKGKIEMPNVEHEPIAPGLALVGDAALATDPLWGIGCGWALQSAEWLADAVGASLAAGPGADDALDAGLARYRRRWRRGMIGHARVIEDFAPGRRLNPGERFVFSAAVHDGKVAATMDAFGSRSISPGRALATALPRAVAVHARQARRAVAA
ncbi:MAG TPA: NAD(P)/FAD-dependent oxidoreductase [Conexibacter sp.]|nr:NAD(P)/FAD-dependent oxidoreductase [Conexibacter sp.]